MSDQIVDVMADPWGVRARDWAEVEDEGSRPLFEHVLELIELNSGSRYLDVGCGSGLACHLAAGRGAAVSGLDSSSGLLRIAAERTPQGDFRVGDMASLPWNDDSFDAVTFINSFFFAVDRQATLREAARVTAPGGHVAVVTWTSPEQVQATAYVQALVPLLPPMPSEVDPFIGPDELTAFAASARLTAETVIELPWEWDYYPDLDTALRGLMSVGLSAVAIANAGESAVRAALSDALRPFRTPTGSYRLHNVVNCLLARK
jgi:SAM-dependent methyltransferase